MKTYIINEFRRLKSIANKKDFVSFVQNSEWMVFDEGKDEIEKIIFVDKDNEGNGTLNRSKKKSFDWYKQVIASNGDNL